MLDYSFIYSGETHISESSPGIKLEMVSPSECNSDCGEECRLFEGYHRIQKRPETFIDDYSLREEYSMNSVFERPIKTLVPRKKKPFFRIGSQSLRKMKKGYNSNKENIEDTSTHKRVAAEPLRDWINRRITGYLIFRNTVKAYPGYMEELKKKNEEEYGHMNKAMGNIWRNLDSQERSLYDDIALNYRKAYTAKVDALVNSDCTGRSLGELMEEFDQTSTRLVRKIEKERS